MNRKFGTTVMLGLVALSAVSVEAAEPRDPGDEASNSIVVVNDYVTPVHVYVEDSEGFLHRLGRVSQGKVKLFEAPADVSELGHFRVRIRPIDPYPGSNHLEIKTTVLNVEDDETVVMWLRTDLTQSAVEVGKD